MLDKKATVGEWQTNFTIYKYLLRSGADLRNGVKKRGDFSPHSLFKKYRFLGLCKISSIQQIEIFFVFNTH
ncbi:MAG: hypothetical protein OQK63_07300 [Ignavibacteriaceae bacterium]|jgi:hypothetical protein|nr:hypothetical protein [Ignavibacteriaceae bacterium]